MCRPRKSPATKRFGRLEGGRPRDPPDFTQELPESCSQREPKGAKVIYVRSANLRRVVCGALDVVTHQKGLITQRSLVPTRDEARARHTPGAAQSARGLVERLRVLTGRQCCRGQQERHLDGEDRGAQRLAKSPLFSDAEKVALEYADAITETHRDVD